MKLLFDSYCRSEVAPGYYDFVIVNANVITCNNQLQVAFRLGKEDDDSYRAYLLQTYPIDLSAESEFIMLMKGAFCSIYPDFIIEADTDNLDMVCGFCNVNHDINGEAKIDIRSIEFTATMCGEVDLSDQERCLL